MKVPGQPEVNIGVVGHVDHGKSTLTERLTGERTDRHSEEIKRGISIRLGYADMAIYKCPKDDEPACYQNTEICKTHNVKGELQRIVSFVDSPGHETLMATMLSGAAIMDGALLVIAANEDCPQPQTKEHLMALGIIGVDKIVIVQNKIDIVDPKQAEENYRQIQAFVKGTVADGAPIVPVSAHHEVNLDVLLMMIQKVIPTRPHEEAKPAKMYVARSFDVNQPGIPPEKIVGGVLGGSLMQGHMKVGEAIEISPGRQVTLGNKTEWKNITTSIRSLHTGGAARKDVRPGGLIAIGTNLDPVLTKADGLVGRVVGPPGSLPEIVMKMSVEVNLLERVVGVPEELKVEGIKTSEPLMVSVGTATTVGVVTSARENRADMALKIPVVAENGQRVAVSRRIGGKWRLIGYGVIK
ncbi:MAG: translation initiation factor IF-2 subunit gamma [Methanobacteriota archaeon]|nr:MAG: translation initiation factor IF-2 subunit gamma [Euryarchaeota archaeon]